MRLLLGCGLVLSLAACNVYDESLLEPTGAGGGSTTTTSSSPVGSGGSTGTGDMCQIASDCPGTDTECGTRSCVMGVCTVDAAAAGTPATMQTPEDCQKNVCNGSGDITTATDDTDVKDDGKECTVDSCEMGVDTHAPKTEGTSCNSMGGQVCNLAGDCVECVDDIDCTSMVCDMSTFTCAAPGCGDMVKNGNETDTDCGGTCPPCMIGDTCSVPADCASGSCNVTCQPSCIDGIKNQTESDVDCGGPCPDCVFGQDCNLASDCDTNNCGGSGKCTCAPNNGVLIISEVKTRGVPGAADEFVELFNPGTSTVTFSSAWTIESRSETAGSYSVRYTGTGQMVPPGGHLLIVGTAYSGATAGDDTLASGITDEGSVVVKNGTTVVDAVCFNCGMSQFTTHVCEGALMTKVGCATNADKSIERKPGGVLGNCIDTQVNGNDFLEITPSLPQNLMSPVTP
jgi:hypothetical protein